MSQAECGCDLLVISPHTDDAEIGLGGTLHRLAARGRRVWAADLTRGELGSNATPAERWREAAEASAVLGLSGRLQLDLPDGFIQAADPDQTGQVVALLRSLRPRWVVTAPEAVRHPDHVQTPPLVERACFLARLAAFRPGPLRALVWAGGGAPPPPAETWTVEARFAVCPDDGAPTLLFDVGADWAAKQAALACYGSQFARQEGRRATMINDPAFLARIERRGRTWGRRAGCEFAEALRGEAAPVLDDLPTGRWS